MRVGHGQVVDTEAAQEFMTEVQRLIQEPELEGIATELEVKSRRFREVLDRAALPTISAQELRGWLRTIFASRRHSDELLGQIGGDRWRRALWNLLHGTGPVSARIDSFELELAEVDQGIRRDVAGEALHFFDPQCNWLWTRWIWDPETGTGALPLVTMEEHDLGADSAGETYLRVGEGIAFVNQTGRAVGFTRFGAEAFGVDVYLACVYGVYLYTITRMRMSQEFNQVIPPLPQLARRLLGVHRMEG
ncbi:MAG: hypothetical protein ABSF27_05115 [Candidatus Dormibacteria bacterium]|jgi:hypothetical protein